MWGPILQWSDDKICAIFVNISWKQTGENVAIAAIWVVCAAYYVKPSYEYIKTDHFAI